MFDDKREILTHFSVVRRSDTSNLTNWNSGIIFNIRFMLVTIVWRVVDFLGFFLFRFDFIIPGRSKQFHRKFLSYLWGQMIDKEEHGNWGTITSKLIKSLTFLGEENILHSRWRRYFDFIYVLDFLTSIFGWTEIKNLREVIFSILVKFTALIS